MGHVYWTAEDLMAVQAVRQSRKASRKKRPPLAGWSPDWSDGPVRVDNAQVVDTLVKIGVAAKKKKNG